MQQLLVQDGKKRKKQWKLAILLLCYKYLESGAQMTSSCFPKWQGKVIPGITVKGVADNGRH